jgi:hypothetical protein
MKRQLRITLALHSQQRIWSPGTPCAVICACPQSQRNAYGTIGAADLPSHAPERRL